LLVMASWRSAAGGVLKAGSTRSSTLTLGALSSASVIAGRDPAEESPTQAEVSRNLQRHATPRPLVLANQRLQPTAADAMMGRRG
jgi:hypothetical protein